MEQYGDGHPYTCLPDVSGFEWLVSAWNEAGRCEPGPSVLSWREIEAYDNATGNTLTIWARTVLREMSEAYVQWIAKGSEQGDIADPVPYIERNEETLTRAREYLIRNRDRAHQKQQELT